MQIMITISQAGEMIFGCLPIEYSFGGTFPDIKVVILPIKTKFCHLAEHGPCKSQDYDCAFPINFLLMRRNLGLTPFLSSNFSMGKIGFGSHHPLLHLMPWKRKSKKTDIDLLFVHVITMMMVLPILQALPPS